jgi:hypothetical protein
MAQKGNEVVDRPDPKQLTEEEIPGELESLEEVRKN